jgi:hypothetical protein
MLSQRTNIHLWSNRNVQLVLRSYATHYTKSGAKGGLPMPDEEWARQPDGKLEISPIVDWETAIEDKSAALLRIWFQVGRQPFNEDVQLQLSPVQVTGLRAALERLERELAGIHSTERPRDADEGASKP